jgi:hypothetical protein
VEQPAQKEQEGRRGKALAAEGADRRAALPHVPCCRIHQPKTKRCGHQSGWVGFFEGWAFRLAHDFVVEINSSRGRSSRRVAQDLWNRAAVHRAVPAVRFDVTLVRARRDGLDTQTGDGAPFAQVGRESGHFGFYQMSAYVGLVQQGPQRVSCMEKGGPTTANLNTIFSGAKDRLLMQCHFNRGSFFVREIFF